MIKIENNIGKINITDEVFTNLAGEAATSCFGVKGMVACAKEGGPWQLLLTTVCRLPRLSAASSTR